MEQEQPIRNSPPFNEEAWVKLIFLLSDTQDWLNELANGAVMQVPIKNKKRLLRKTYYLTVSSLAHILERHFYKIPRHPETSKFTIPVPEILAYLRDISAEPGVPVAGFTRFQAGRQRRQGNWVRQGFFSAAGLADNRKIIRNLLFAANSTKMYNKDTPGDLLFHMRLFESLINAAYLINQEKRKSPLEIPNYELFNPNLFRGWGRDTCDWDFIPHSLSLKEYKNPYVVFKRFFKFKKLPKWKSDLQDILSYALGKDTLFEAGVYIDCLSMYLHLTKLIEAAHPIDVREIYHIGVSSLLRPPKVYWQK